MSSKFLLNQINSSKQNEKCKFYVMIQLKMIDIEWFKVIKEEEKEEDKQLIIGFDAMQKREKTQHQLLENHKFGLI